MSRRASVPSATPHPSRHAMCFARSAAPWSRESTLLEGSDQRGVSESRTGLHLVARPTAADEQMA